MPSLQRLWDENKEKGLHIFHVEVQGHSDDEVTKFVRKRGLTFPNTTDRGPFSEYQGGRGIPYAFVIGVDGTVVYQASGSGYKSTIHEELKKVRYPGLGKTRVAKGLEKAAGLFGAKSYAKSIAEAEKKLAKAQKADDSAVTVDAQYIIARANEKGERLQARVEKLKAEREYTKAMSTLQLISRGFKGMPLGDEASSTLKAMKKDPAVKKELKADASLAGIQKRLVKIYDPAEKKDLLRAFAKKFEGTKAAERAEEMINWM